MSQLRIVFADTDEMYLTPLVAKFLEELSDASDIVVITETGYLKDYFSEPRALDMLIIHESLYSREFEKHNISYVIILTEEESTDTKDLSENRIYKYTSVREIYNDIMNSAPSSIFSDMETRVIFVYSPIGGAGSTFVSIGLAAALSKAHRRIFYMSTSPLQEFPYYLTNKDTLPVDFVSRLKNRVHDITSGMENAIGYELFDYLLPFPQSTSSLGVGIDEFRWLADSLKKEKKYDFIIIDSSCEFTSEKTSMMSYCDKTVLLAGQSSADASKFKILLNNINIADADRFVIVCNRYDPMKTNWLLQVMDKLSIDEYIPVADFDASIPDAEILSLIPSFQKLAYMFM